MRDYLLVIDLVARAGKGDKRAWDALVERYSPLIWSICRGHRLGDADARAVSQSIWRQLVNQLDEVQDPGALAGWLAAAAWRDAEMRGLREGDCRLPGTSPVPDINPVIRPGRASSNDSRRNVTRRYVRHSAACPLAAIGCSPCSSTILPCRTPRSAPGWASRSAASGRPAAAAWMSSAATP
jgi:hypothetical protein